MALSNWLNVGVLPASTFSTITASGIIKTDDTTNATTVADGSLQTDGGLSVTLDAVFGDDIKLITDSAVISFGVDSDTTLTHTDGSGLTLNSTNKIMFGDTGTFIHQSSDGVLTIESDTTVDINGAVALNGAITGATNITLSGELDAATLDISGNADIDGTLETDALTINGAAVLAQATTSAVGAVELATSAEINTSTDANRVMTPDLFAASNYGLRYIALPVGDPSTAMSTGNNKAKVHIPAGLNGMDLVEVHAEVSTAPAGSTADIQLSKNGSVDMLSTKITIDASETGSDTAATAAVINTSNDNVATNDTIQIDIDQVGSSTAGSGLIVTMGFRIP